ncbi:hypothetical protein HK096_002490 [Nowakowskiella sp. JEL0078]|nr:hypothetical protein HK096_002490 [Nowakowskiella sp. JEL0078]
MTAFEPSENNTKPFIADIESQEKLSENKSKSVEQPAFQRNTYKPVEITSSAVIEKKLRRKRCLLYITSPIVVIISVLVLLYGINQARCQTLDPSNGIQQLYSFDGNQFSKTQFDFQTHGSYYVKSNIQIIKSTNSTGVISLKIASYLSSPLTPSETKSGSLYSFSLDPIGGILGILNIFNPSSPSCVSVMGTIALPLGSHDTFDLKVDNGPVSVSDISDVFHNDVKITAYNGKVQIFGTVPSKKGTVYAYNGNVDASSMNNSDLNLNILASNGAVAIQNSVFNSLQITAYNGKVGIFNTGATSASTNSSNGAIEIDQWNGTTLYADSKNGKITATNIPASKNLQVTLLTSNGQIQLVTNPTYSGKFHVGTSNGGIEVSGNDVVFTSSSNSLKVGYKGDTNSGSSINLHSDNGKVSATFS